MLTLALTLRLLSGAYVDSVESGTAVILDASGIAHRVAATPGMVEGAGGNDSGATLRAKLVAGDNGNDITL